MTTSLRTVILSFFFVGGALLQGCSSDSVLARGTVVDRSSHSLSIGSLLEMNGTYGAGCTQRTGNWSVGLGGFLQLTNAPLSVVLNDPGCTLSLTSIRAGSGMASELYAPSAPLPIAAMYQIAGSPFRKAPADAPAFFANVRMLPDGSFSQDFTIQAVYSEDPSQTSLIRNSDFVVVSANASAGGVPVPDYAVSAAGMGIQVDGLRIVQSVSGQVDLTDQGVTGQSYIIDNDSLSATPTHAEVEAAFAAGTPQMFAGANPSIAASAFGLVGASLTAPIKRNIIIANEVAGVRSYQIVSISFASQ